MRTALVLLLVASLVAAHPSYNIVVDAGGNVYFLDWPYKRVMKAAPDGKRGSVGLGPKFTVARYPCNGIVFM